MKDLKFILMKYAGFIFLLLFAFTACKKNTPNPRLSFSSEEAKWFIYKNEQRIKFKNAAGDSLIYIVSNVRRDFKKEYKDPFTNSVEMGLTEFYTADLKSTIDSIFIYFYKEFQHNSDPYKMRQTINWNAALSQFVALEAIKSGSPFTIRVVNNVTYSKVTKAIPDIQTSYPHTKWAMAYYDQQFGFIELVDLNGNSWLRE